MKFATITPNRGVERATLLYQCEKMLRQQTLLPDSQYFVCYPPEGNNIDIVERIQRGIEYAKNDGIDLVFIAESDDFYPPDYFERFAPYFEQYEFFGDDHSLYYNIRNRAYRNIHHPFRASLFTTGFKISALNLFDWPSPHKAFLDIDLWKYAKRRKKKFINTGTVGIKGHGCGKVGGKGHIMRFKDEDKDYKLLASKVTPEALEFYKTFAI